MDTSCILASAGSVLRTVFAKRPLVTECGAALGRLLASVPLLSALVLACHSSSVSAGMVAETGIGGTGGTETGMTAVMTGAAGAPGINHLPVPPLPVRGPAPHPGTPVCTSEVQVALVTVVSHLQVPSLRAVGPPSLLVQLNRACDSRGCTIGTRSMPLFLPVVPITQATHARHEGVLVWSGLGGLTELPSSPQVPGP